MSSTNRGAIRREADYYPTPQWCTRALLRAVPGVFDRGIVLDPFAGDGAILRVLQEAGAGVRGLELRPECREDLRAVCGYTGYQIVDSLRMQARPAWTVVTNPSFSVLRESIEQWTDRPAAFLLRCTYWGGQGAAEFWQQHTPHAELRMPRRAAFVAVCKGRPSKAGQVRTKGCGLSYPVGTRGVCECGGTIGDGTDSVEYLWALWNVHVPRPMSVIPLEWCQ